MASCAAPSASDSTGTSEGNFTATAAEIATAPGLDVVGSEIGSLALDATGAPQVALQAANEKLAWATKNTDGTWKVETVDSSGQNGRFAHIAMDGGRPTILYYGARGETRMASRSADNVWTNESVNEASSPVSFAVVSGTPHALVRSGFGELFYGKKTASGWTFTSTGLNTYLDATVLVGADGSPEVVAIVPAGADPYGEKNIVAAKPDAAGGAAWTTETLVSAALRAYGLGAAKDSRGRLHVAYSIVFADHPTTWQVEYAIRDGAHLSTPASIGLAGGGGSLSLVVDASGRAHVAETDGPSLRMASQNTTGAWQVEPPIATSYYSGPPSLAVDAAGKRSVVFHEYNSNRNARYRYARD